MVRGVGGASSSSAMVVAVEGSCPNPNANKEQAARSRTLVEDPLPYLLHHSAQGLAQTARSRTLVEDHLPCLRPNPVLSDQATELNGGRCETN